MYGCVNELKCLLDCNELQSSIVKSQFSMDESFTLSDMIRLLLFHLGSKFQMLFFFFFLLLYSFHCPFLTFVPVCIISVLYRKCI